MAGGAATGAGAGATGAAGGAIWAGAVWAGAGAVILSGQYQLYLYWNQAQRESFCDWFLLPSLALGLVYVALIARVTRASVLEVLSEDYVRTARSKGVMERVIVNRHDTVIGHWIAHDGGWERDEIELLRWITSACYGTEPKVEILDIGANIGTHTIAFARFPFPQVTVHAFEAQRIVFQMLAAEMALRPRVSPWLPT